MLLLLLLLRPLHFQTIQSDGSFDTLSQLIFTASRFENGASFRCEADNLVMREENDKPIHETLVLEVLCEYSNTCLSVSTCVESRDSRYRVTDTPLLTTATVAISDYNFMMLYERRMGFLEGVEGGVC